MGGSFKISKMLGPSLFLFHVLNLCSLKAEGPASFISPLVSEGQLSSYSWIVRTVFPSALK